MYRILSASKDTYITNKIINNKFRATDTNLGQAGTLDLFKLYNETTLNSSTSTTELTKLLLKFDVSEVTKMHNDNIIDVGSNTFKAELKLHDIYGGQTTPRNFNIIVFPLSQSFDEGIGMDVISYSDIGVANFITASYKNGNFNTWHGAGASKSGSLGQENIDIIVSGTVQGQSSAISLCSEMYFDSGEENLVVDVTNFVSASAMNLIDNHGFLIALSGSHEKDNKSYFVKRFASRNTLNTAIRPKLIIKFDDSQHDNHKNFEFDASGSLYLHNFKRRTLSNLTSGSNSSEVTGSNCMILKLETVLESSPTGSFKQSINVSQVPRGTGRLTGIYSASFEVNSFNSTLYPHVISTGSITFKEIWSSSDETVTYLSSSITINQSDRNALDFGEQRYITRVLNLRHRYKETEFVRIRVFVEKADKEIILRKKPFETPSEFFNQMFYRVRDFNSGDVIIPFDLAGTKLSHDSKEMYFDFYMGSVPKGRTYVFDFMIKQNDFDLVIRDAASKFIIE